MSCDFNRRNYAIMSFNFTVGNVANPHQPNSKMPHIKK